MRALLSLTVVGSICLGCSTQQGQLSAPIAGKSRGASPAPQGAYAQTANSGPAKNGPVQDVGPVTLRYNPPRGAKLKFSQLETAEDGVDPTSTLEFDVTERITAVGPDSFSSVTTLDDVLQDGARPPSASGLLKGFKLSMVRDGTGRVLSSKMTGAEGLLPNGQSGFATSLQLPGKAVNVGDSWTTKVGGLTKTYKVTGIQHQNGRTIVNLDVTGADTKDSSAPTPVKMQVDAKTGILVSSMLEVTMPSQAKGGKPLHVRMQTILASDLP